MPGRRSARLFKFWIENPDRFRKKGHAAMLTVWLGTFKEAEAWVRKEFRTAHPKFVDVHRLRANGNIGLSRRYFRDMSYKTF